MKLKSIKPLVEASKFTGIAKDKDELVASIVDGYFTKDARNAKGIMCFFGGKKLKSIEGMPLEPNGNVFIGNNELTDLKGSPEIVTATFRCSNNKLTTLKGGPRIVHGAYIASHNELTSLEGAPERARQLILYANKIESIEGAPKSIGSKLDLSNNKITSLAGVHTHIMRFTEDRTEIILTDNPIKESVLGLLLIPGLVQVSMDNTQVSEILNAYLRKMKHLDTVKERNKLIIECQSEMLDANLDDFAQL